MNEGVPPEDREDRRGKPEDAPRPEITVPDGENEEAHVENSPLGEGRALPAAREARFLGIHRVWVLILLTVSILPFLWAVTLVGRGNAKNGSITATGGQSVESRGEKPTPAGHLEGKPWLGYTWFYIVLFSFVGSTVLLCGTSAKYIIPRQKRWGVFRILIGFSHEVGVAILVACIVTGVFELSLRKREHEEQAEHKREVEEDVFKAIFGHSIDNSLIDEVVRNVLQSKLMRDDFGLTFDFFSEDPDEEYLRLRVRVSYRIKNVTKESQNYYIKHTFTNICPDQAQPDSFTALKVLDATEDPDIPPMIEITEEAIKKEDKELFVCETDGPRHAIALTKPIKISAEQSVLIKYTYEVNKRFSDLITFHTTYPTTNYHFRVTKGKGVSALVFKVDSAHPNKPILVSPPQKEGEEISYEWKINAAVLPGQGIELYWHPRPKSGGVPKS